MEDLVRLIAIGEPITQEVVATVWHKWFGDPAEKPGQPIPGMEALAADLSVVQQAHSVALSLGCQGHAHIAAARE
ncbi:hypothetical protein [Arthrobacter sp. ISL-65]|uniref:hypothetical protein n=1 Tax=Arthrobacter sp. ISL-65 TaxID=2819112 RepID=UPI001BE5F407|nr:hypothetical protein [Arthrobacter sp. ISL-65]MBT2550585.1 hypothetical protein [Arthrobacter sp. ISL-65]